jgi:hypothetical protein
VVAAIPIVGGWIGAVVVLLGLGALLVAVRPGRRREAAPAAEAGSV